MSSIGTGIASAVAQTSLQAQQVGRERAAGKAQRDNDASRVKDLIEAHLQGLDEGDESSASQLHMDDQMPDHQAPGYEQVMASEAKPKPTETPDAQRDLPTAQKKDTDQPGALYQHLDVKA